MHSEVERESELRGRGDLNAAKRFHATPQCQRPGGGGGESREDRQCWRVTLGTTSHKRRWSERRDLRLCHRCAMAAQRYRHGPVERLAAEGAVHWRWLPLVRPRLQVYVMREERGGLLKSCLLHFLPLILFNSFISGFYLIGYRTRNQPFSKIKGEPSICSHKSILFLLSSPAAYATRLHSIVAAHRHATGTARDAMHLFMYSTHHFASRSRLCKHHHPVMGLSMDAFTLRHLESRARHPAAASAVCS